MHLDWFCGVLGKLNTKGIEALAVAYSGYVYVDKNMHWKAVIIFMIIDANWKDNRLWYLFIEVLLGNRASRRTFSRHENAKAGFQQRSRYRFTNPAWGWWSCTTAPALMKYNTYDLATRSRAPERTSTCKLPKWSMLFFAWLTQSF